jgi:methionyl-tRNA formyltransferase
MTNPTPQAPAHPLKLAFMGTPDFAVPALEALHQAGHIIKAVYCQPPKPTGRGQQLTLTPIHRAAERLGLAVRTPTRLRNNEAELTHFASLDLDAAIIVAYGQILPADFLAIPQRGCLNIHASLLPRWRGAAPIQAALLAGDAQTGITIMHMDAGLDTGPMLLDAAIPITATDTAATLHDRLAPLGAGLLLRALTENPLPRPQTGPSTYAPKLSRADAAIDWSAPAATIERRIRAFAPWPGTEFALHTATGKTEIIKIHAAHLIHHPTQSPPGTVLDDRLTIACGTDAIRPTLLQRPGRTPLEAADFLPGYPIPVGTILA